LNFFTSTLIIFNLNANSIDWVPFPRDFLLEDRKADADGKTIARSNEGDFTIEWHQQMDETTILQQQQGE
jgi:hypothetical protein